MSAARMERLRLAGVALVGCLALGLLGASSAFAETKTFTKAGCETWEVPAGVTKLSVAAVGAAGQPANGPEPGTGGNGDEVSATLAVTPGEVLDVCVNEGGGKGGEAAGGGPGGGNGGGASGVARSKDFSNPVLVAGGGGGGGEHTEGMVATVPFHKPGGDGGAAGQPGLPKLPYGPQHGLVEGGSPSSTEGPGRGGPGENGDASEVEPGAVARNGAGGGGGGGYVGGGGGEAGGSVGSGVNEEGGEGGAGGTDHCGGTGVTCGATNAGAGTGSGSVTVTAVHPTTLTTSLSGEGKKGEKITVKEGEAVTDQATLSGENASTATGTATYNVYGDSGCTKLLGTVSSAVSGGKSETSPLTFVEAGTYYWQVSYSGDENNQGSEDTCGAEVLTVTPKPSTCGKTTVGKSSAQLLANFKRVNQCTLPVNATLSEIGIYLTPTSHSGSQLIKGIVYADSKGSPTGLLGTTIQLTFTSKSKAGWYHLAFATPLKLAAGNYWIGMITGASQNVGAERYDSVANAQDSNTNSYTAGASKTFGSFNKGNEQMSLYATFTPEVQSCAAIRPNTIC
jgi:hypothetical protein